MALLLAADRICDGRRRGELHVPRPCRRRSLRKGTAMIRLLAAILLAFVAVPAAAETPVERHGQLRVEGNRILDRHGQPVMLRGMSLVWSQCQPRFYNEDAVRWLRDDWNVNV